MMILIISRLTCWQQEASRLPFTQHLIIYVMIIMTMLIRPISRLICDRRTSTQNRSFVYTALINLCNNKSASSNGGLNNTNWLQQLFHSFKISVSCYFINACLSCDFSLVRFVDWHVICGNRLALPLGHNTHFRCTRYCSQTQDISMLSIVSLLKCC